MLRVELGKAVHRLRTWVFAVGLAGLAVIPVIFPPSGGGEGPPFLDLITRNGLFAALVAVVIVQPFFLPLGTGLLAGEAIAGEASGGTLRYLIARPTGRRRLVLAKFEAVMTQVAAAVGWLLLVGLVAGSIRFGLGPLPTLSGTTLPTVAAFLRVLGAGLYALLGMAGLAAIGLLFSTLTTSGPGATVATIAVAIASQIMDNLSALHAIHPYLLSHGWVAFVDLFRSPVTWDAMRHGLVVDLAYTALFLGLALALFSRKDVTS
jgi:ABC-2 type transport system permease protein